MRHYAQFVSCALFWNDFQATAHCLGVTPMSRTLMNVTPPNILHPSPQKRLSITDSSKHCRPRPDSRPLNPRRSHGSESTASKEVCKGSRIYRLSNRRNPITMHQKAGRSKATPVRQVSRASCSMFCANADGTGLHLPISLLASRR